MTKWHVIPLEEPPKKPDSTPWSVGLAMFAAFVMPFVLLMISSRYQGFVAQARARISVVDRWGMGKIGLNTPAKLVAPKTTGSPATTNVSTPQPATNHE